MASTTVITSKRNALIDAGNITKGSMRMITTRRGKTLRLMQQYFHSGVLYVTSYVVTKQQNFSLADLPKQRLSN